MNMLAKRFDHAIFVIKNLKNIHTFSWDRSALSGDILSSPEILWGGSHGGLFCSECYIDAEAI